MTNHGDLDSKLKTALAQCERLQHENGHLKKLLGDKREEAGRAVSGSKVTKQSSNADKNRLFRSYFRGRDDVFSLRWENDNGKSGYAPVCINEWKPICAKPGGKCSSCLFRKFKPLSDKEIQKHLAGKQTIGIYPLLPNDTCWFLVADFDKATWQEDAGAFLETCDQMAIPTGLERSRSGTGAHVWIFLRIRLRRLWPES